VSEVAPDEVAQFADELEQTHYSIHFHAWAPSEFLELVTAARTEYGLPLDLEAFERNDNEFILVLRRIPPHAGRGEAAVPVATEPRTPEPA
jgi:hypothetical protein